MKLGPLLAAAGIIFASAGVAFAQAPPGGPGGPGGGMAACRDDMQKYCSDKTGPDRRACMQTNKDKLSDGCKAAMAARSGGAPAQP